MPTIKGSLNLVTDRPVDSISEVWVRARETRGQGDGLTVGVNDRVPVSDGVVEFPALPGAAILVLVQNGIPVETLPMLVGDEAQQSLRLVVQAAQIAGEADKRVIEQLSAEIAANAARAEQYRTEAAASASAAQASETAASESASNAKTSETRAKTSETNAKTSETNAAASASASASSASSSETQAGKSAESATQAVSARDAAKTSETNAAGAADAAAQSESNAKQSELAASGYADNAAASERAAIQAQVRSEAAADRAEDRVDEWVSKLDPSVLRVKSTLSESDSLDAMSANGVYPVPSIPVATALELPIATVGVVEVFNYGTVTYQRATLSWNGKPVMFQRVKYGASAEWSGWERQARISDLDTWRKGYLSPDSTPSLDGLQAGYYQIWSGTQATAYALPVNSSGALEVFTSGTVTYQRFTGGVQSVQTFQRVKFGSSTPWTDWQQVGGVTADAAADSSKPLTRKMMMLQELTARKGGKIGVGDKPVIALRFDDAPAEFKTVVLPLLKELALPFSRVTTSHSIGTHTYLTDQDFTDMQDYCIQYGGEVWNHGKTHMGATGYAAIRGETIEPLHYLRSKMSRIPIDCYAPPGGITTFEGHLPSTTPSSFYDTVAGQEVASYHAIASGYFNNSLYRQLDGVIRDGQRHWSADGWDLTYAKNMVGRLKSWGVGALFMWHPNKVHADFESILRFIAAERDAGNLIVLTNSGLEMADKSHTYRRNLLRTTTFGGVLNETWDSITANYIQGYKGATVELVCNVNATGTVTTSICGVQATHTVSGSGTVRQVATIPLDIETVTFTCSGTVTDAHVWQV